MGAGKRKRLLLSAALLCPALVPGVARAGGPVDCMLTSIVTEAAGDRTQATPRSASGARTGLLAVPIYTSTDHQREVLDGSTGHLLWRRPGDGILIARLTASSVGAPRVPGILEVAVGMDDQNCPHLVATTLDARTGHALRKPVWSPALVKTSSRWLNVVTAAGGGTTRSGFGDVLIEVREGDAPPSLARTYEPHDFRDISPGLLKRGQVWLVDAKSQSLRRLTTQPALTGPGPMSAEFGVPGSPQASVLVSDPTSPDGQRSTVLGYRDGRQVWKTSVNTLPLAWTAIGLPTGPVFVTTSSALPDSLPAPATSTTLLTAVQGSTGRMLWEKSFVTSGGFAVHRLQDDILVDNQSLGQLTRLRGDSGVPVWTLQYVWQGRHDHTMMGDVDGDRVPDLLLMDSEVGPAIVSGATGALLPRPLFSVAPDYLFPVGDLNGDGAADVVGVPGLSQAVGAYVAVSGPAIAFSGSTGQVLWSCSLPPASSSTDVVGGDLAGTPGDDVVIQYLSGSQFLIDGRTGSLLWTHEDAP